MKQDWSYAYGNCEEEIPEDAPPSKGKKIRITVFADGSNMGACVNIVIDRAFILYKGLYLSSFS